MHRDLVDLQSIPEPEMFEMLSTGSKSKHLQAPIVETVAWVSGEPALWLFSDREGYVMKRKADFSPQTRIQILKSFERMSAPNGSNFIGNVVHVSLSGLMVKPVTKAEVMKCLKGDAGAVGGAVALQPYLGLKTHNSVYHNTYEIKETMNEAHRHSEILARVAQDSGIAKDGRAASSAELTGNVELVESRLGGLNQAMNGITQSIVTHIARERRVRVVGLVVEYVVTAREQLQVRQIVSCVTCPEWAGPGVTSQPTHSPRRRPMSAHPIRDPAAFLDLPYREKDPPAAAMPQAAPGPTTIVNTYPPTFANPRDGDIAVSQVWNPTWKVPPSKGHVDHTVATRSRNLARQAARHALEESGQRSMVSQAASLSAPRPFEEFRHIRVKARSMEEHAANAHMLAALRPGATKCHKEFVPTGPYGKCRNAKGSMISRNFINPKVHGRMEAQSLQQSILSLKKEVGTTRGAMSTMGVGLAPSAIQHSDYAIHGYREAKLMYADVISRDGTMAIWTPPPPPPVRNRMIYKRTRKEEIPVYSETEYEEEMRELEVRLGYSYEQLRLLFRTFGRRTKELGHFSGKEHKELLMTLGIDRPDVCDTIWKGFNQKIPGVKKVTMSYKQAAEAMAVFGVGSRGAQAEGLFKCADVNKNCELSRAEMLKFLQTNRAVKGKLSVGRQKVECFRSVGKLFDEIGAEGKEEVRIDRFIQEVAGREDCYQAFRAIIPYHKYFASWDEKDTSLQNVLNALFFANSNPEDHEIMVRERVEILAEKIDEDGSGTLDQDEIVAAIKVLYGGNMDEALEMAAKICGDDGMSVEEFVEAFTELAEHNLEKFAEVERAYGIA